MGLSELAPARDTGVETELTLASRTDTVALDEGLRMTSTVVDVSDDTLRIGHRFHVDFEDHEEGSLPVFRIIEPA